MSPVVLVVEDDSVVRQPLVKFLQMRQYGGHGRDGLRSESAELETIRPNTRLVEKPYGLVMLMDTPEDMLEESKDSKSGFGLHRRFNRSRAWDLGLVWADRFAAAKRATRRAAPRTNIPQF